MLFYQPYPQGRLFHYIATTRRFGGSLAIWVLVLLLWVPRLGSGQSCPRNIDFEKGDFDGWRCYTGYVSNQGGVNQFSLTETPGPVEGRHTLIRANNAGIDPYGGFPNISPNGSGYSIRLGNDLGGGEGEAISYDFTIPANRNTYSLIYYYAVVFQDPDHEPYEQPRMETEITNVTDNMVISCASFAFIPYGTGLPGFFQSPVTVSSTPIWCKDWTPVTINLDGNAGKTIRLTFRTADCTFRRHFGYAYIDVDTDCSGEFTGASFCPQDSGISIKAPFGFLSYTWFNQDMSREMGTGQVLSLSPPPPSGTRLKVKLVPYEGFGCEQTLSTRLLDNLDVRADAGMDTLSCNQMQVRIGSPPKPGVDYLWTPATGLSNAQTANPFAAPLYTTRYVLTVKSPGGGCNSSDTVLVLAGNLGNSLKVQGKPEYCLGSMDSAVLVVEKARSVQWYINKEPIPGATERQYRPNQTGTYFALLRDELGCIAVTPEQPVNISSIPVADFLLDGLEQQCRAGNQFVFVNASTNQTGAMQYLWDFGGYGSATDRDGRFSFPSAGHFRVKLVVRSNSVCADSLDIPVTILPSAEPAFEGTAVCEKNTFRFVNTTPDEVGSPIRYRWMVDGREYSTLRVPADTLFARPGKYEIRLEASTELCPLPVQVVTKTIQVESRIQPKRYRNVFALPNKPFTLEARAIGQSVQWLPDTWLDNPKSFTPVFSGNADRDYTIRLFTEGGCETIDSLRVQIVQQADIQVPNAFTPNGDGLNDYLRPVGMGITEFRYFRVFNRWGQLVFDGTDLKKGWDGTFMGKPEPTQSYVWMVEGIGPDGLPIQKKGNSVLIR